MKINQISVQDYSLSKQLRVQNSSPSFKGYANDHYYPDEVIEFAKKCINTTMNAEQVTIKHLMSFSDAMVESSSGLENVTAPITRLIDIIIHGGAEKSPNTYAEDHLLGWRLVLDTFTAGLNELLEIPGALNIQAKNRNEHKKLVENVKNCVKDLLIEQSNKEIEASRNTLKNETTYLKMQEAMRTGFVEPIKAADSGKSSVKIPNIIAIETDTQEDTNKLIKYAVGETGAKVLKLAKSDEEGMYNMFDVMLENIEKNNLPNNKRTIIAVDGFENMANDKVREENMGMLKRVASELSNKYKTTIIFGTDDMSKIAPAIKQGHRIGLQILKKAHV